MMRPHMELGDRIPTGRPCSELYNSMISTAVHHYIGFVRLRCVSTCCKGDSVLDKSLPSCSPLVTAQQNTVQCMLSTSQLAGIQQTRHAAGVACIQPCPVLHVYSTTYVAPIFCRLGCGHTNCTSCHCLIHETSKYSVSCVAQQLLCIGQSKQHR